MSIFLKAILVFMNWYFINLFLIITLITIHAENKLLAPERRLFHTGKGKPGSQSAKVPGINV